MNLLIRETNESVIRHFRVQQYMLYRELIKISILYLKNFGLTYDETFYDINNPVKIVPDFSYHGESHYAADLLSIKLFPDNVTKEYLLYTYMPRLIEETFFKLNGSYFIPIFFISDEPIVLKEKSISIYSLFQPISLYLEDNRVTFMQDNYELSDFIHLIIHDWTQSNKDLIIDHIPKSQKKESEIYAIFSNKLKCANDPNAIKLQINRLIFDNWTYELYQTYYGIEFPSIDVLIKIAFDRLIDKFQPSFGNLKYKRLTFIEQIMKGFFKRISISTKLLLAGKQLRSLMFQQNGFAKYFFTDLDGQTFYDTVNGFSSIIAHKASFKNPGATSKLPKSVSELHETHKMRICSNTITNTKPGQMISLVPTQDIDPRFGIFEPNFYELRHFQM